MEELTSDHVSHDQRLEICYNIKFSSNLYVCFTLALLYPINQKWWPYIQFPHILEQVLELKSTHVFWT